MNAPSRDVGKSVLQQHMTVTGHPPPCNVIIGSLEIGVLYRFSIRAASARYTSARVRTDETACAGDLLALDKPQFFQVGRCCAARELAPRGGAQATSPLLGRARRHARSRRAARASRRPFLSSRSRHPRILTRHATRAPSFR